MQNLPHDFKDTFWYCLSIFFQKSENLRLTVCIFFNLSLHISTVGLENSNITFGKWKCCYSEHWLRLPTHSAGHLPLPRCRKCELEERICSLSPWRAEWIPRASTAPYDFHQLFHSASRKQFLLLSPSNLQDFLELAVLKREYCFPTLLILMCNQSTNSSRQWKESGAPLWLLS